MSKDQNNLILKIYTHKSAIIKVIVILTILAAAVTLYISKSASDNNNGIVISQSAAAETAADLINGDDQTLAAYGPDMDQNQSAKDQTAASGYSDENIVVDVSGAVNSPTVVIMPAGSRVYEAIEKAGGLTDEADLRNINRAVILNDGDRLYIPTKTEVENSVDLPSYVAADTNRGLSGANGAAITSGGERTTAATTQNVHTDNAGNQNNLININTADAQELQKLSGVGPAIADRIITYRNNNGSYKTIDDLKKVSGIGAKTFDKFKDKITV